MNTLFRNLLAIIVLLAGPIAVLAGPPDAFKDRKLYLSCCLLSR